MKTFTILKITIIEVFFLNMESDDYLSKILENYDRIMKPFQIWKVIIIYQNY